MFKILTVRSILRVEHNPFSQLVANIFILLDYFNRAKLFALVIYGGSIHINEFDSQTLM